MTPVTMSMIGTKIEWERQKKTDTSCREARLK